MEGNQKIHCTVGTCKYNEKNQNLCKLQAIQVDQQKIVIQNKQMNQCVQVIFMKKINNKVRKMRRYKFSSLFS